MTELATILWNPRRTVGKIESNSVKTYLLILAVVGIDFIISLGLLPMYSAAATKAVGSHPELAQSIRTVIIAVSLLFSSLINVVLALFVALLLFFATMVFGAAGSYRKIIEAVLIGSAPSLLSRVIRVLLYVFKSSASVRECIIPLSALMPHASHKVLAVTSLIDVVDLWSFALIAYAFSRVSGLSRWASYGIVLAIWGGLQAVLLRLQMSSGAS
jgi:hypothetical protein